LIAQDAEADYVPELRENTFCSLFTASLKFHFQSTLFGGLVANCCMATVFFTLAGGIALFHLRDLNTPLNYTDMASIYSTVEPLEVIYNTVVEAGSTTDAILFMDSIVDTAGGSSVMKKQGTAYAAKTADQSYEDYYISMADQVPNDNFGAYTFQQITTSNPNLPDSFSINAVLFASIASDSSIPSFSAILLETIARRISGQPDLSIKFTNTPLPPS